MIDECLERRAKSREGGAWCREQRAKSKNYKLRTHYVILMNIKSQNVIHVTFMTWKVTQKKIRYWTQNLEF